MPYQLVLRFGLITNNNLPIDFLDRLKNGIFKYKIKAKKPNRKGFLAAKIIDKDVLFARFYDEGYAKDPLLQDDNQTETTIENLKGQFKEILFFKNRYFAYQTSKKRYFFEEIIELINSAWSEIKKDNEPNLRFNEVSSFPPKLLKHFYEDVAKGVSYLKLQEIGITEPNPAPIQKEIADMIKDIGDDTRSVSIRSKRAGNLQRPKLLKQMVTISKVIKVRGLDIEGLPFTATLSGRISVFVSDNEDERVSKLIKLGNRVIAYFLK